MRVKNQIWGNRDLDCHDKVRPYVSLDVWQLVNNKVFWAIEFDVRDVWENIATQLDHNYWATAYIEDE